MDFQEKKFEIGIALLAAVMVTGLFRLTGGMVSKDPSAEEISYEMPRPKSDLVGEFGLGDREIDRRYVNPFEKKKKAEAEKVARIGKPQSEDDKKKKKTSKTAKKKTEEKKPTTSVNVVERDETKRGGENEGSARDSFTNPTDRGTAGLEDDTSDEALSPDQWRALMSAQPTRENMNKLVKAYAAGEVDESTFYGIIEDLLRSQNTEKQGIALYGLRMVPNLRSFEVVAGITDSLPENIQVATNQFLMSYSAPSKHGVLQQALQGSDRDVALKAAEVVLSGIQNAQNGNPSDPREVRGEGQSTSITDWTKFGTIFQGWATSGDASLQSVANSILALLPSNQA